MEQLVLNELDFDILTEGVPSREIELVSTCALKLLKTEHERIFCSLLADLEKLLWFYVYSGKIKIREK